MMRAVVMCVYATEKPMAPNAHQRENKRGRLGERLSNVRCRGEKGCVSPGFHLWKTIVIHMEGWHVQKTWTRTREIKPGEFAQLYKSTSIRLKLYRPICIYRDRFSFMDEIKYNAGFGDTFHDGCLKAKRIVRFFWATSTFLFP